MAHQLRITQATLRPGTRQLLSYTGRKRQLSPAKRVFLAHSLRLNRGTWGARTVRSAVKQRLV